MTIACRANKQEGNENNVFYLVCTHLNANFNDHDIVECIHVGVIHTSVVLYYHSHDAVQNDWTQ